MQIDTAYFTSIFQKVLNDVMNWLPSLVGIAGILLLGWICAWIIKWTLSSILRKAGLDLLIEKSGAKKFIESWGIRKPVSKIIGKAAYWVVIVLFVLVAVENIGLNIVAGIFKTLLDYVPHLIGAFLIILIGAFFANFIGEAIGSMAEKSGMVKKSLLGRGIKYILFLFVTILALQELGVETILLSGVVIVAFSALSLTLALAFGYGSRELARNIMAGFHARETYFPGIKIKVGDHEGVLMKIGTYKFVLENGNIQISLPNCDLTEKEVVIYSPSIKQT